MNYNTQISEYIDGATAEQIPLLEELRELIHQSVSNVSEEIKWKMPVFNNGKDFAYMRYSKKHITLGFYNIEKLKDPENLLEGQGNTLKHIKVTFLDDSLRKQIVKWLVQITE